MKLDLKTIGALCGILAFAVGGVAAINKYFAKSSEMSEVRQSLDLQSTDAAIEYRQRKIDRIQMQRRPEPLPADAVDRLEEEREALEKLEREREQKEQYYRSSK